MPAPLNTIQKDKEGFLTNLSDWNEDIAQEIARQENIELTAPHWQVIKSIQGFHQEFDHAPAMRPLCKYIGLHLGKDKGNSIYLLKLFPGSPAKLAAKIAGLPKPPNCL